MVLRMRTDLVNRQYVRAKTNDRLKESRYKGLPHAGLPFTDIYAHRDKCIQQDNKTCAGNHVVLAFAALSIAKRR